MPRIKVPYIPLHAASRQHRVLRFQRNRDILQRADICTMVVVSGVIPRGWAGGCDETVDGLGKELGNGFGGEGRRDVLVED